MNAVRTQAALYEEIDLELSWSEAELPERERTKHVHRLHPYLGKFVPQLVEVFLGRYGRRGGLVWDPFSGSGTTLVEANAFGAPSAGCDVSAFNVLLARVKTAEYDRELLLADVVALSAPTEAAEGEAPSSYLASWFAPTRPGGAPGLSCAHRAHDVSRPLAGRALARRALGAARPPLRPRLSGRAGRGRVLLLQAPARLPPGRGGGQVPAPLRARRRHARPRLRGRAAVHGVHGPARRRAHAGAARRPRPGRHVTALSRADRLPRAARVRLRAPRPRAARRARRSAAASPATARGSRQSSGRRGRPCAPEARSSSS